MILARVNATEPFRQQRSSRRVTASGETRLTPDVVCRQSLEAASREIGFATGCS